MRTYKIVPLAPEALSKSYFKFLSVPLVLPKEGELERAKKLRGNPKDVLPFADRARLQDADYIPAPEGIYLADDGTIFISVIVDTPDLTGEMVAWWCAWHNLDPLRYAIWNPEDHYDVQVSEEDRARILDESIPVQERSWGITSIISESMDGEKPTPSALHFCEPASVGFRNKLFGTDGCLGGIIANNTSKMGPIEVPVLMAEFLRKNQTTGQNQWVVHAWLGHGVKNGKDIKLRLPLREKIAQAFPAQFLVHSHKEMSHLNKVLPALYAENKDKW